MKTKSFLWALVLLILSGCGTTLSTNSPNSLPILIHGMPYYLPIGVIMIKGEWTDPTKPRGANTSRSLPGLGSTLAFLIATNDPRLSKDPNPSGDSPTTNSVTVAVAGWTITITGAVEAESNKPLYAIPRRNYIFDDDYHVTVNSKHLLSAGNTTAYDRTADTLGAVASLISTAAKISAAGEGGATPGNRLPFFVSFRTNNQAEFDDAQTLLGTRSFGLKLDPGPSSAFTERSVDGNQGLIFRLAEPYRVSLKYPNNVKSDDTQLSYAHNFLLPGLQNYVFDYRRMPFVKKVTEIGFTDGMLTDYHENLPSPILGVLGIPKAIVTAIIPLPSSGGIGSAATGGSAPSTSVPTP